MLSEEDCIILRSMIDDVHDTKVPIMHSNLHGVVTYMCGFSEEELIVAQPSCGQQVLVYYHYGDE